jgi:predicted transcriptional regulator
LVLFRPHDADRRPHADISLSLCVDTEVIYEYLMTIYNTILLKDVVSRFGIRNVKFLENLVLFLADNTGSIVSSKKISDYLKSQKLNISTQVVIDYLGYLESSFLISKVKRTVKKSFQLNALRSHLTSHISLRLCENLKIISIFMITNIYGYENCTQTP